MVSFSSLAEESSVRRHCVQTLGRYTKRAESQLSEINELRLALKDDAPGIDPARFNALMLETVDVPNYRPTSTAYGDLSASGNLREISGTPLRHAIAEWEANTNSIQRSDQDALNFRNHTTLPFVTSKMSLAAIAGESELLKRHGFARTQFE